MVGYGTEQAVDKQKPATLSSRLIKLGLFVGITGGLLYSLLSLVQPQYRSSTTLLIEGRESSTGTLIKREVKVLGSELMIRSFLDVHPAAGNSAIARQGPLQRVLVLLGLSSDPAKAPRNNQATAFRENLSIGAGSDQQTIMIGMRSSNPKAAARLANQYAASYISSLETRSGSRPFTMTTDDQAGLLSNLQGMLADSEARLATLRQNMRVSPFVAPVKPRLVEHMATEQKPDGRGKLTLEQLSQVTAQLILARADREQAELRAKLVQDMLDDSGRIESTSTVLNSGLVQTLLQKRARMEQRLAELKVDLLPSHPQMRRLNRDMSSLRTQIKSETTKAVANLENEVLLAAKREDSIKESLAKLKEQPASGADAMQVARSVNMQSAQPIAIDPRIAQITMITSEIAAHRRNLAVANAQAEARSNKDVASSKAPIKATVISPAIASNNPVFPKKILITLLGMFAALILGLVSLIFGNKGRGDEASSTQPSSNAAQKGAKDSGLQSQMGFGAKPVQS